MGSIPLPALHVNPPQQQEGPIQQYAQLLGLKSQINQQKLQQQAEQASQLENQQRQVDLQSQQAVMKAYQEADGDLSKAIPLAAKYGARPDALIKLKQANIQQQAQSLEMLQKQGDKALRDSDLIQGWHEQVAKLPPEQRPQAYQMGLQQLQQAGVDMSHAPQEYPGDQQFDLMGYGIKGHKAQLDELAKQTELQKSQAQTAQAQAATQKAAAETQNLQQYGMASPDQEARYVSDYMKENNLPSTPANRQKARLDFIQKTKVAPGIARTEVFLQRPIEVADPNNPGETVMVPQSQAGGMKGKGSSSVQTVKSEQKYMTSGKGSQQLTAFNTAMNHLDTLDKLSVGLNNTNIQAFNRAAQAWAEQTGNPAPANFAAAKNAMSGEVAAALKASGATDQEIAHVGETFSRAQSPAQLKGAINTYRDLLRGKRDQLKQQYESGMQGQPNFGGATQKTGNNSLDQYWKH